jgi:subtilisin family serine protease
MSNIEKEYIVTVHRGVDWKEVHQDIIRDTSFDDSVDSGTIPDRACPCVKERPINTRNTHYRLTEEEAHAIRNDPRVLAVQAIDEIPEPEPAAVQDGIFDRSSSGSGRKDNWGLIRHTSSNNVYGSSLLDQGLDYNYVLDGTGVDIVIMDTGIQDGHPEWESRTGLTRLKKINWFTSSGVSGTQPANFYTDVSGHGTHCAGTMAGKNFGWAKNANIYSITTYGNPGNSISFEDAVDCLIGWHNNKPINSSTGLKRPTVVNMSFQYSWYIDTTVTPNQIQLSSDGAGYNINGGRYRGVNHNDNNRSVLSQTKGVIGSGLTLRQFGRRIASKDADVEQLIANGIHVSTAAGNDYMKVDRPGGVDYDNYLSFSIFGFPNYMYYHRGASPSAFEGGDSYVEFSRQDSPSSSFNNGFDVGAIDNSSQLVNGSYLDRKVNFSNSGPGVDIYAAGDAIISADKSNGGLVYFHDSDWKQSKKSGTSMASPQVCGMIACILQAHPDWTPGQVKDYMINNSQPLLYTTNDNDDYTVEASLHGGNNRIAHLPMNGSKKFTYGTPE